MSSTLVWITVASVFWILVCGLLFGIAEPCNAAATNFISAKITCLSANEMGDFLAGGFAPLAFLWLIAAVFLQKEELAAQRLELQQSREIARQQFEESRKNVEYIRRQTEIMSDEHESEQLAQGIRAALQPAYDAIKSFELIAGSVEITHVFDTLTPFSIDEDRSDLRRLKNYLGQIEAFWAEAVPMNGENGPVEFSDSSKFLEMHDDLLKVIAAVRHLGDEEVISPLKLQDIERAVTALEGLHALNDQNSPYWRY